MNGAVGLDLAEQGAAPINAARLLLVEPDDQAADPVMELFTRRGWIVHRARTQSEALGLADGLAFDCAVIEINLPDAIGTDAWVQIKQRLPYLLGIMTTGSPSLHLFIDAVGANVLGYLLKPVDIEAVWDLFNLALNPQ